LGSGAIAIVVATALVLLLASPALPVLLVGVAAVVAARTTRARLLAATPSAKTYSRIGVVLAPLTLAAALAALWLVSPGRL
jgi:hypothetical protein